MTALPNQAFHALQPVVVTAFDGKLADQWRSGAASVDECLIFIKQDIRLGRAPSAYRLKRYREALRAVSEAEIEMDGIGMAYARSSDDWREDAELAWRM